MNTKIILVEMDSELELFVADIYKSKMEPKIKLRKFILICLILMITSVIYYGFFCSEYSCAFGSQKPKWDKWAFQPLNNDFPNELFLNSVTSYRAGLSYDDVVNDNFHFDINAHDVMVFLHIQKTGGTSFGRHLVQDLDLQRPCTCQRKRKRCYCFRPNRNENWLFSRYSTGWKCGLHADWTELTNCVESEFDKNEGKPVKRRYFYITLVRDPVNRYLSEFKHIQRGASWRTSKHWCGGRIATKQELPKCYSGLFWTNLTLEEFLNCPYNLAANRQTRMICDLSLVGCYNRSYMSPDERNKIMLASAKHNLASMPFFLLTEYQQIGQYMFEETFNLRFAVPFSQNKSTRSSRYIAKLKPELLQKVRDVNSLDIELYKFAKALMFRRFERFRAKDPKFEERWKHLGELPVKTEFNWDEEIESLPNTKLSINT